MGSDVVPDWGQACNSTVYRIVWRSVKHFLQFSANFFLIFLLKAFQLFHHPAVENSFATRYCGPVLPMPQQPCRGFFYVL